MASSRSSGGARALPGKHYTSQAVYDTETERIFGRRWLCVGLAASIPEAGRYVVVEIEGESLLTVRDRSGEIRCFFNVCRHRGTRLCDDRSGSFTRYIVCPYHAWAYELTGELAAAPTMDDVDGFDRGELPLHAVATFVWEGLVFVCFDETPTPFEQAFVSIFSKFSAWHLADLVPVHRTEYEVQANWKLLFQTMPTPPPSKSQEPPPFPALVSRKHIRRVDSAGLQGLFDRSPTLRGCPLVSGASRQRRRLLSQSHKLLNSTHLRSSERSTPRATLQPAELHPENAFELTSVPV